MKNKLINIENLKLNLYSNILNENNSNSSLKGFASVINEDKVLKYQYYTFKNIKELCKIGSLNESIKSELTFLDHFTIEDYKKSQSKLKQFVNEITYNSIDVVNDNIQTIMELYIFNGLTPYTSKTIDKLITEIKNINDKQEIIVISEDIDNNSDIISSELVLKHSLNKFNEKYNTLLTEQQKSEIRIINGNDMKEQKLLFDKTKNKVINELKKDEEIDVNDLKEAINKINEMTYNTNNFLNDIIDLNSLI